MVLKARDKKMYNNIHIFFWGVWEGQYGFFLLFIYIFRLGIEIDMNSFLEENNCYC